MKSKEELKEHIQRVNNLKVTIDESKECKSNFEKEIDKIIEEVEKDN